MAEKKFIDIERIIASKNPGLLKKLPGFVLRYLKRILHQQEINTIISENRELKNQDFCSDIIRRFNIKLEVRGLENVPKHRGIILASNHPLGGMDALALVDAFAGYRNDIRFIVNDILMNLDNLSELFVGVNKHGKNAKSSLQTVDKLFASDLAVFVFPAGLVSRKINGEITDLDWKKTFITRAKRNNKEVVPVHIDGGLSNFFYRLARWRERLGIKVNVEMLYLVNELFKQKNKTMTITFGKPIVPETFNGEKNDVYWANWVKDQVYALKG